MSGSSPRFVASLLEDRCFSQRASHDDEPLAVKLPSAFGFRSSPFGRVNERINAVDRAVVPPDSALAICFRRVFLILAILAVNGSETLAGSKLHPPRFLRLVTDATGEEAADVSRLVAKLLHRRLVTTLFFSLPFPFDDGFRGDPRDLYSDEGTVPLCLSARFTLQTSVGD